MAYRSVNGPPRDSGGMSFVEPAGQLALASNDESTLTTLRKSVISP
jgi:hypothetical protein